MSDKEMLDLKELQQEALRILHLFHDFCEEHGLRYSLAGGTLLGAVRHGGFIPWDDDIDVTMPRPDYERFRSLAKEVYAETGLIQRGYPNTQVPESSFTMLVNPSLRRKFYYRGEVLHYGIDVFPLDGLPDERVEAERMYAPMPRMRHCIALYHADLSRARSLPRRLVKNTFAIVNKVIPIGRMCENRLLELARRYAYDDSTYIGSVSWGLYGVGERMEKAAFEDFGTMTFEDAEFNTMGCWDAYLTGLYGDYMQLPPEEDQHAHDIMVWWETDDAAREELIAAVSDRT